MPMLPTPGGDEDRWGAILNDFLRVSHREDGMLKGIMGVVNVADFLSEEKSIQDAIDAVQAKGGGIVFFPAGEYLIDTELLVTTDYVRLIGASKASVLKAGQDNQRIIHFAANHGGVENLRLDGNGYSGVSGLEVSPKDEEPILSELTYNRFSNLLIIGCQEGVTLQAGPRINGTDSKCWYNVFDHFLITYTKRGVWLKDPISGTGSGPNRNQFYSIRVGQVVNTGIQIDRGGTNTFIGCSFEGIGDGTTPNEPPTAILIEAAASHNAFIGARFEANIVDVENHNQGTEFYASDVQTLQGDKLPVYLFGGGGPSISPVIFPGLIYPEGSLPGYANQWNVTKAVTFHEAVQFKKDIASKYITADQLLGSVELVDDTVNGANGEVAVHTSGGDWGLYMRNVGQFLRKGQYRIVHRYRLTSGSAGFGIYNRTAAQQVDVSAVTPMQADGNYHTEVVGYFELNNENSPEDAIDTYYQPAQSDTLYIEWIRIEEAP